MLKIINKLKPFFEDNYRRIHVREYAKIQKISPPTASKLLENLYKEKLLKKEIDKQYFYYFANKSSKTFRDIQRIYWRIKLKSVIINIEENYIDPVIILFGSLAKAEAKKNSDIDIAIFTFSDKKDLNIEEKKLKRTIQIFTFKNIEEVPKELRNNILNGYILGGLW